MDVFGRLGHLGRIVMGMGLLLSAAACQVQNVSPVELQLHQSWLDKNGLTPLRVNSALRITFSAPAHWELLPLQKNLLYTQEQWRAPDHHVGMGVAYVRMPIPISAQMILWAARQECVRDGEGTHGRVLGQWTDGLGRMWFEAENSEYHVKGYAMTRGRDAWLVYGGYSLLAHPPATEIALAYRAADAVAPFIADH